jgi:hypothetical protein
MTLQVMNMIKPLICATIAGCLAAIASSAQARSPCNPWQIGRRIAGGVHRHRPIYEIEAGIVGLGPRIAGVFLHRSRALGVGHFKHGKQIVTLTVAASHY